MCAKHAQREVCENYGLPSAFSTHRVAPVPLVHTGPVALPFSAVCVFDAERERESSSTRTRQVSTKRAADATCDTQEACLRGVAVQEARPRSRCSRSTTGLTFRASVRVSCQRGGTWTAAGRYTRRGAQLADSFLRFNAELH